MTGDELRRSFLRFFEERGHVELPSLPLIPRDDPSVLFVTAGMQQMIPFFLGEATPPSNRLTSIQKCLRTVDIEEVGDESHLTFFEMLGNFSVGDYFVPEALRFTWEYLTGDLALPPDRLWATVYPGDEFARANWLEIGLPAERVVDDPENWWTRAGLAGPAGPDSEVHYDRGLKYGCGEPDCSPVDGRENCHRFVEIWNNVFMQSFVNEKNEVIRELASKNIDTGQGFERILMVVQGVETVYETDVFAPIVEAVASTIGTSYGRDEAADKSLRIIADHCRSLAMAIADGALPGNEGRGYVLRRLLRRAVLRGRLLGIDRAFLRAPVEVVIRMMSPHYPNVAERQAIILETIESEEARFAETLARGLPMIDELMNAAAGKNGIVSGEQSFLLHDTYGLPLELIQEIAAERHLSVDVTGFEAALLSQQERGRAARPAGKQLDLENLAALAERVEATDFVGYSELESGAKVVGMIVNGNLQASAPPGAEVELILNRTPFYAESGGQVGDTGELVTGPGKVDVSDTQRPYGGLVVHRGTVGIAAVNVGDEVTARVDARRRGDIRPHHSATHLVHLALHEVLGPQATQAGSLVAPDRLRFDFQWPRPLTDEEVERVQRRVNELVFEDVPVVTREMAFDEAVAEGAMALFGEKYGAVVRMVTMGPSKELCGGTHVAQSVEIGPVVIISESGIGTGVRRIEALAGRAAYEHFHETEETARAAARALGTQPSRIVERAEEVVEQLRASEKRIAQLTRQLVSRQASDLLSHAESFDGDGNPARLIVRRVEAETPDDLLQLASTTLRSLGSGVVVMGSVIAEKPQFAAAVSNDLQSQGYNARQIAQKVGQAVGGGAGGSESFAQGGGRNADHLDSGLEEAREFIRGVSTKS
ncbi:MAG TPA: alanine--tRNA ligase [Chloroflexota bacterium]|nr:alanine--tRNA ligase [Chloroflexota bacterium]